MHQAVSLYSAHSTIQHPPAPEVIELDDDDDDDDDFGPSPLPSTLRCTLEYISKVVGGPVKDFPPFVFFPGRNHFL
jgi:hypothetical protein